MKARSKPRTSKAPRSPSKGGFGTSAVILLQGRTRASTAPAKHQLLRLGSGQRNPRSLHMGKKDACVRPCSCHAPLSRYFRLTHNNSTGGPVFHIPPHAKQLHALGVFQGENKKIPLQHHLHEAAPGVRLADGYSNAGLQYRESDGMNCHL